METRRAEEGPERNPNTACQPWPWPWLVISQESHSHILFSLVKDDHGLHTRSIPEVRGKFIRSCSQREWLMIEDEDQYSLVNLMSMERIQLPTINFFIGDHICVMSSPHTDTNFRLLFIDYIGYEIFSWQPGQEFRFRQQQLIFDDEDDEDIRFVDAINLDGKVYAVVVPSYSLVCADIADPNLCFRRLINGNESLPKLLPYFSNTHGYLVESCGQLLYVHKTCIGLEALNFQIFRADFSKFSWVKLHSIGGDRVIFLDNWRGLSSPPAPQCGIKGNTIYFIQKKDRNLYTFDMEEQCISMTLPNPLSDADPNKSTLNWILIPCF